MVPIPYFTQVLLLALLCWKVLHGCQQAWDQVHVYLYVSTFKYTFDSTCTLLKYFLITAGVLVFILRYSTKCKYLYILSTFKYTFDSTWQYLSILWFQLEYLYLYLTNFQKTCTFLKYFQMYLPQCLVANQSTKNTKLLHLGQIALYRIFKCVFWFIDENTAVSTVVIITIIQSSQILVNFKNLGFKNKHRSLSKKENTLVQ